MFTSCNSIINSELTANQKAHYKIFLKGLANTCVLGDISAYTVKQHLATANVVAASMDYEIKDRKEGYPIKQGTIWNLIAGCFTYKKK